MVFIMMVMMRIMTNDSIACHAGRSSLFKQEL